MSLKYHVFDLQFSCIFLKIFVKDFVSRLHIISPTYKSSKIKGGGHLKISWADFEQMG